MTLARIMGPGAYGVYAFCMTVTQLLAVFSEFGVGTVLVRFSAAYERTEDWSRLRGLLEWSNKTVFVISLLLMTAAAGVFLLAPEFAPAGGTNALWLALALLPVLALGAVRAAALRGLRKFVRGQAPENLIRPSVLLALAGGWWVATGRTRLPPFHAVAFLLIASFVSFVVGAQWLLRALPPAVRTATPKSEAREWLGAVGVLSVSRGGRVAISRLDVVFMGALAGAEATGVYKVASAISGLVAFGLNSVNSVAAPYFSRLHVRGELRRTRRMLLITSLLAVALALPVALALGILGKPLIEAVYGPEFRAAFVVSLILCVGQLFNAAAGPIGTLLNMTGQERWSLISVATALVLSVPAYLLIVPRMGANGGALVTTAAIILLNALFSFRVIAWLRRQRESDPESS